MRKEIIIIQNKSKQIVVLKKSKNYWELLKVSKLAESLTK